MAGLFARHGPEGLAVVVLEKQGVGSFTPADSRGPLFTEEYLRHSATLSDRRGRQAALGRALIR
ncbi:MAG: hypothetical protein GY953_29760, partial [bacterium]|nr:hypothetical protein [bacterium]